MRNKNAVQNKSSKPAPFFRLLLPLIAGILLEDFFPVPVRFQIPVFCFSIVLFISCNIIPFSKFFGLEWISGIAIQFAFFSFGRILIHLHRDIQIEHSACYIKNQPSNLLLRLLSDPLPKQNSLKCVALVSWLIKDQTCFRENEKVLVYFSKKLDPRQLSEGSFIMIRKNLQPIENSIASDFDYKKYCRLRHIYAQVFLHENEFSLVLREKENSISSMLEALRKKILIIIKKQIPAKSANSLLEALMVGFTDDLDPGLLKSYADSGVIHIIAISGLHLALICHILQLALKKTGQKKTGRWVKLFAIVSILWGYSLLSGASPSVIRSAMMFSLVLFGRNIFREAVLYNTLASSAFLLLCFDPNWIWDTGFQLSYAAVLSLRLFSKPVRNLIPFQNKILGAAWDAGSVSIAAQILTTPISIYYFHRFPSYFLIANLLAVPLSSGILAGGILLSLCSWIQPAGKLFGWLLGGGIQFLNEFIRHISQLPGAVISPLYLSLPQLILSYGIIFCFYRFLNGKEKSWLLTGLGVICLFQLMHFVN
jgi:competence protein ComEC